MNRRQPLEHQFQTSTARITYFEWGPADGAVVLLLHATGFHARCWDQVVASLPPQLHVYAVDMRGHGRSEKIGPYQWDAFAGDISELIEHLGLVDAIGVGHSMGGHCLTQVAASHADAFSRLLLIDPVILPPQAYSGARYSGLAGPEDHPVSKRKGHWRDWQEMFDRFVDRKPFSLWQREVLEDYCRYGVLPAADGNGFELACPGLVEASIYMNNTQTNVHGLLREVRIPVVILRAKTRDPDDHNIMDFSMSPTWPELAAHFPNARDVYLPHLTHFIPMQEPELVARFIVHSDAQAS
jgi:pimeloyl-ACP methyl ester carboxylesterase